MINKEDKKTEELIHPLIEEKPLLTRNKVILGGILIIFAGIISGFFLAERQTKGLISEKPTVIKTEKIVGSTDIKTFKDVAEGRLEKGDANGEGTHRLVRPGGESQTVYLTSSLINLDDFVGKKVRVWGETFAGQKAGWLMDVGRVEVLQ